VNQFIVSAGQLRINCFDDDGKLQSETVVIGPGEHVVVNPGERHQFVAQTEVDGVEVYWSTVTDRAVDPDDIVRFSLNGIDVNWASRPTPTEYVYCCGCNRQLHHADMCTVNIGNALRDMCKSCVTSTDAEPVKIED
jgi:hypothetical protein